MSSLVGMAADQVSWPFDGNKQFSNLTQSIAGSFYGGYSA